jgi:hypothetical protein
MSRGFQTINQTHITKAIKGASKAGYKPSAFTLLKDGSIRVEISDGSLIVAGAPGAENEWDAVGEA